MWNSIDKETERLRFVNRLKDIIDNSGATMGEIFHLKEELDNLVEKAEKYEQTKTENGY